MWHIDPVCFPVPCTTTCREARSDTPPEGSETAVGVGLWGPQGWERLPGSWETEWAMLLIPAPVPSFAFPAAKGWQRAYVALNLPFASLFLQLSERRIMQIGIKQLRR